MAEGESRVVLLAGASGFVGNLTLDALLDAPDVSRVYAISRRPLGREHPRLANRIVQFDQLGTQLQGLTCDVAFCCLGTTIKHAGSPQAFRSVDLDSVIAFARAAKIAQAQRFVVVSFAGADSGSKHLYQRTKGEMEAALTGLGFVSLDILQPSFFLGWRSREIRPLELGVGLLLLLVNPLLVGKREPLRGISARTVAAAMLGAMRSGRKGVQRYTYKGLQALSQIKRERALLSADPKRQSRQR